MGTFQCEHRDPGHDPGLSFGAYLKRNFSKSQDCDNSSGSKKESTSVLLGTSVVVRMTGSWISHFSAPTFRVCSPTPTVVLHKPMASVSMQDIMPGDGSPHVMIESRGQSVAWRRIASSGG